MRFVILIAITALVFVSSAQAAKITVAASYDGNIDLTICGTGSRTVEVRVIDPAGHADVGQAVNYGTNCFQWNDWAAPLSGTYRVEIGNLNHNNTFASTTVTVP